MEDFGDNPQKLIFFQFFLGPKSAFFRSKNIFSLNKLLFLIEAKNPINIQLINNHFLNFQLQNYNFSAKILKVWPPKKNIYSSTHHAQNYGTDICCFLNLSLSWRSLCQIEEFAQL